MKKISVALTLLLLAGCGTSGAPPEGRESGWAERVCQSVGLPSGTETAHECTVTVGQQAVNEENRERYDPVRAFPIVEGVLYPLDPANY